MAEIQRRDVSAALADRRPPKVRSVTLSVGATTDDEITLGHVLHAVITEVIASWPDGSTWVVEIGRGYLQSVTYTPTSLLEVGPEHVIDMQRAVAAGWIDPHSMPPGHGDHESRRLWADNPVMEVQWAYEGVPSVVPKLVDAATGQLKANPHDALTIRIWTRADYSGEDESIDTMEPIPTEIEPIVIDA